jgi:ligand-binding SRPBCC domain-containing protein
MALIKLETVIEAPIELVFDLARDIGLHALTVSRTKERAIAGRTSGPIGLDETVTFEAVHFGIKQRLSSKIIACSPPDYFVDEMQKGAFKSLRHEHRFESLGSNSTLMRDTLHFESPLGILGRFANWLFLTRYMRSFLLERNANFKQLVESGEWAAQVKKPASY